MACSRFFENKTKQQGALDDKGNPQGGGGFGGFGQGGGFGGNSEDFFEDLAGVFGGRGNSRRKGAGNIDMYAIYTCNTQYEIHV